MGMAALACASLAPGREGASNPLRVPFSVLGDCATRPYAVLRE